MAVQGFKGLGWFLCGMVVAPACYMVTSAGAAERAKLASLEAKIVAARKEIRGLETEYGARANMAQLEQWNGEALRLAAPAPDQYFASETQLAALDAPADAPQVQLAAAIVPAGAPQPQMAAAVVPAAPRPAAQPAVLARGGPLKDRAADAVAANGAGKARAVAVAMVDKGLLSTEMESDLKRLAAAERAGLR